MATITTEKYRSAATEGIGNPVLQDALANLQERLGKGAADAYRRLSEGPDLRLKAHDIRMESIEHLDILLDRLTQKITENGGHVFFAPNADSAISYLRNVARQNNVRRVVKGKSMVSEEIGLNDALSADGIEVVVKPIWGNTSFNWPASIPRISLLRPSTNPERISDPTFCRYHRLYLTPTIPLPSPAQPARPCVKNSSLPTWESAGVTWPAPRPDISPPFPNEGNIRMSSTLPRVHVALMGMERVIARLEDHDVLFRLLTRGAAAQNMATYVSYVGGPRRPEQPDGPDAFHLIILDNGRSKILADPEYREMLCCIRCAACLNVCPVYRKIGGHAYGSPYCGPVGAVVTPLLVGINRARHLCQGETLCGACRQACPINIDLPRMLLRLRAQLAEGDPQWSVSPANPIEKLGYGIWSTIVGHRRLYDLVLRAGRFFQKYMPRMDDMLRRLPPPVHGWTANRNLRPLAGQSFHERWSNKGHQA